MLRSELNKSPVTDTELRALVVEPDTEAEAGDGNAEECAGGDDVGLEFGLGDCFNPRALKRAKADSVLEERELVVDDNELRARGVAQSSWTLFLRLSFFALCSPTSSRLGSVQTMSHILKSAGRWEPRCCQLLVRSG